MIKRKGVGLHGRVRQKERKRKAKLLKLDSDQLDREIEAAIKLALVKAS